MSLTLEKVLLTDHTSARPHGKQEQVRREEGKGEGQSQTRTEQRGEKPGQVGLRRSLSLSSPPPSEAACSLVSYGMCRPPKQHAMAEESECVSRSPPSGKSGLGQGLGARTWGG